MDLTPQQISFCNNLLQVGPDGTRAMSDYEAYQLAYPSAKTKGAAKSGASRLLKKDKIKAYLAKRTGEVETVVQEKVAITKDRILEEEGVIAFHDIGQLFDPDTGLPIENITKLPEDVRRAIASIEIKETEIAGVKTKTWKLKLNDKGASLNRLEKCFGMQREALDVDAVITIKGLLEEIDGTTRGKLPIDME
jgi:phage terminase small subunit